MFFEASTILLSLIHGSVWMKSTTPISKLVVQKYVDGRKETCSETCAGENLICNFEGINFVPPEELEARIQQLLPGKHCNSSNKNSTLTTIAKYQKYNGSELFSYNRMTQCTTRYVFTPGGPIPPCTVVPASHQLLICKCMSRRDYMLVSQSISSKTKENCNGICARKSMTCNFAGIDRIPLEEIKAQIIDLFPGSFCYGEKNESFTLSVYPGHADYKRGCSVSYNTVNRCTAHYRFEPNGSIPNCTTLPENEKMLICKCENGIDKITTAGCYITNTTTRPTISNYNTDTTTTTTAVHVPVGYTTNTTVIPATTCSPVVLSMGDLEVIGVGCGVAIICGGAMLFGLVWLARSRAQRAKSLKSNKKVKKIIAKSRMKTNNPAKTDERKPICDKQYLETSELPRSKIRKSIKSKTVECTYTKTEAVKSVVYSETPDTEYETVGNQRN